MKNCNLLELYDNIYEEIEQTDAIITTLKISCLNKEINGDYYNLNSMHSFNLSKERNQYINLLTVAQEKINKIKTLNNKMENNIRKSYNKIPTIAADK